MCIYLQFKFDIDESRKKDVLRQFSELWRGWRKRTAAKYVTPFEKDRKKLKSIPPNLRGFVEQDDWKKFVKWRFSDEGKEKSKIGIEVHANHKYPHRLGRRTYAGLKEKMKREKKWTGDGRIPRDLLWIRARQGKKGKMKEMTDEAREAAAQIKDYSKQIAEGTIVCEGNTDALVKFFGEEHPGRVRAAGTRVTPSQYFHTPRQRGPSNKDNQNKIRELEEELREKDVQARISEENLRKEFQEQLKEQTLDTERKLQQQLLQFKELLGKSQFDMVQPFMPSSENVPALGREAKVSNEILGKVVPNLNGKARKKSRVPNSMLSSKKVVAQPPTGPPHLPSNKSQPCKLFDSIRRLVALGHIIHTESRTIHGRQMLDDGLRVSVDVVEIKSALLPRPSPGLLTVQDAKNSLVEWPERLVVLVGKEQTRVDAFEDFYKRAREVFKRRHAIEVELHRDVFGQTEDVLIHMALEDIEFVCRCQCLTNNAIVLYIRFLYAKLDGAARKNKFGFINPAAVHFSVSKTEFVKNVLNRLKDSMRSRKYIFIPCNTGNHWVLIVFFDGVFYYLNPLASKCRYQLDEQMSTVSKALRKLGAKRTEEKVFWVDVKHNPKQTGTWECGFYVMLYMKHIMESHDTAMLSPKEMFKSEKNYGMAEIDEIRNEWINYISPILEKY
ncbi:hypothetical protein MKW94_028003 [Papaver nudicaule]|uniref:Ubiquitin-like protease family profile domain-containing protein n=2 Tax=Papaver nudicaule TaxID=74823 RepID=A0AA42B240_PAPNU|nr:hypothetical protein [Papaver nudicaule]